MSFYIENYKTLLKLLKIKINADFPGSQIAGLSIIKIAILSKLMNIFYEIPI